MPNSYSTVWSRCRLTIKRATMRLAIKIVSRLPDQGLVALSYVAEKLTYGKPAKTVIKQFRELIKINHPSIGLVRRILNDTQPQIRKKLVDNLIINGFLLNQEKKLAAATVGEAVPTTILISPTMRCNLNCVGCYAGNYNKADDLTFFVFDRIIREAKDMGVSFFTLLGGEPLFYPHLFDILEKHQDVFFQCYTNGTLIDGAMADKISAVGNVLPILSIEGHEKETDERRGAGVHEKVLKAMDILKSRKIPFGFSVAVTNKNAELISSDEFIDEMIKRGAYLGWFFLYMPVGKSPDLSLMPTPAQRRMLVDRVAHIRETKPLFIVDFWNDAPFVGGCIAGKEYVHITSKGDVEPCIFTHFAVDNIKDKSLKEVMNSDFFRDLRRRQPYNENLFLPCMWIDNPEVSREVIAKFHAYPTHEGADDVLIKDELKAGVDVYSSAVKEIYNPLWRERSQSKKE